MNEKATALVIDDEPQIRKLLRIVLEQEHYRALESDSGRHGLSEIALRDLTWCCWIWGCRTWTASSC